MDESLHPFISDFGLSKLLNDGEDEIHEDFGNFVGTPAYVAPEIIKEEKYSKKSDVYAFAMILYELFVGALPFTEMNLFNLFKKVTNDKLRPELNKNIPLAIRNLIELCWNDDPQIRPSFENIVTMLKNDSSFITKEINEKIYREYIEMIDEKIKDINVKQIYADIQKSMLIFENQENDQINKDSMRPKIEEIDSMSDDDKKIPIKIDNNCTSCNEKFENKNDILYIYKIS